MADDLDVRDVWRCDVDLGDTGFQIRCDWELTVFDILRLGDEAGQE
jgi:hypothetical protein